jgi:hypothetical protein
VPLRDVLAGDRGATLFDYLSRAREHRVVVSERDEVDVHALKLVEQVHHSYEEAQGRGEKVAAPTELLNEWSDIDLRLTRGTNLAQLGIGSDSPGGHIRSQPTVELKGRVGDWVAEIRRLARRGGHDALRRGDARARRANDRADEGIRRLRRAD